MEVLQSSGTVRATGMGDSENGQTVHMMFSVQNIMYQTDSPRNAVQQPLMQPMYHLKKKWLEKIC